MKIEYAGEAEASFQQAIEGIRGYTVRLSWNRAVPGERLWQTGRRDVELIGTRVDDDGEQWLDFYPTEPDGGQLPDGDPRRISECVELALVEGIYVY